MFQKTHTKPDVVLIHGLARTGLSMLPLKWYLQHSGFIAHVYNYPSRRAAIDRHSAGLMNFLKQRGLLGREVNFITHSLGSLVLLDFLRSFPSEIPTGRAVLVGPPCNGSAIAKGLARWHIFRRIFGPTLLQLASQEQRSYQGNLEIGVIAGKLPLLGRLSPFVSCPNDGIVALHETKLLGAKDFAECQGLHAILMSYPRVLKLTKHFLLQGEFPKSTGTTR